MSESGEKKVKNAKNSSTENNSQDHLLEVFRSDITTSTEVLLEHDQRSGDEGEKSSKSCVEEERL